jgi:hypothetical protein
MAIRNIKIYLSKKIKQNKTKKTTKQNQTKKEITDCDFGIVSNEDRREKALASSTIENAVNMEAIENSKPSFIISCFN